LLRSKEGAAARFFARLSVFSLPPHLKSAVQLDLEVPVARFLHPTDFHNSSIFREVSLSLVFSLFLITSIGTMSGLGVGEGFGDLL